MPYYLPALHLLTGPFFLFLFLFLFLFHDATWDSTGPRHSTDESYTAQQGTVPDPATVQMNRNPCNWKEGRKEGRKGGGNPPTSSHLSTIRLLRVHVWALPRGSEPSLKPDIRPSQ